jgi:signal peptidase II
MKSKKETSLSPKSSLIAWGFLFIAIDQITKFLVFDYKLGNFLNWFRPVFGKQYFFNYDFAFSLKVPYLLMYLIYGLLLAGLVYYYWQKDNKTKLFNIAIVMILAGAISNLIDRALYGYVRDFIYVFWGNVFNLADVFIVAGIIILLKEEA